MDPSAPRARFSLREHRLKRKDFERAYSTGGRASAGGLTVVAVPNELAHPRLGLSVGKRVSKSAVRRNRVRRIFREAFRLERAALPGGVDVVMIAQPDVVAELARVREALVPLCARALERGRERRARGQDPSRRA